MNIERVKYYMVIFVLFLILYPLFIIFNPKYSAAFPILPIRSLPHPLYAPQEVLVEFVEWATYSEIQKVLAPFGTKDIKRLCKWTPVYRVRFSLPLNVEGIVTILNAYPLVKHAEPNFYVEAELIPNDPIYIYQWHMGLINMELAWDIHNGAGAIVAVLDTGVAYRDVLPYALAPDLAGTLFVPGWDIVNDDPYPDDDNGHGTHIVGTIAQTTNNFYGCAGVAYGCSIMPVKVLDENSNGLLSDVIAGIYFAVDNGAHIINTSFGTVTPSLLLEDAITYASLSGLSIICSSGNGASTVAHYPSSYPECISVSAVKLDKTIAFYSNYGTDIDICAPGGDLVYDLNLDGKPDGIVQQTHDGINFTLFNFYIYQGTSCAAAHVTGVAALIVGASGGTLGPDLVRSALETTAEDLGTIGWDQYFGWGLVNAASALASLPLIAIVASASPLQPINNFLIPDTLPVINIYDASASQQFYPQTAFFHGQPISFSNLYPGTTFRLPVPINSLRISPLSYNYNPFVNSWNQISRIYQVPSFFYPQSNLGFYGFAPISLRPIF